MCVHSVDNQSLTWFTWRVFDLHVGALEGVNSDPVMGIWQPTRHFPPVCALVFRAYESRAGRKQGLGSNQPLKAWSTGISKKGTDSLAERISPFFGKCPLCDW